MAPCKFCLVDKDGVEDTSQLIFHAHSPTNFQSGCRFVWASHPHAEKILDEMLLWIRKHDLEVFATANAKKDKEPVSWRGEATKNFDEAFKTLVDEGEFENLQRTLHEVGFGFLADASVDVQATKKGKSVEEMVKEKIKARIQRLVATGLETNTTAGVNKGLPEASGVGKNKVDGFDKEVGGVGKDNADDNGGDEDNDSIIYSMPGSLSQIWPDLAQPSLPPTQDRRELPPPDNGSRNDDTSLSSSYPLNNQHTTQTGSTSETTNGGLNFFPDIQELFGPSPLSSSVSIGEANQTPSPAEATQQQIGSTVKSDLPSSSQRKRPQEQLHVNTANVTSYQQLPKSKESSGNIASKTTSTVLPAVGPRTAQVHPKVPAQTTPSILPPAAAVPSVLPPPALNSTPTLSGADASSSATQKISSPKSNEKVMRLEEEYAALEQRYEALKAGKIAADGGGAREAKTKAKAKGESAVRLGKAPEVTAESRSSLQSDVKHSVPDMKDDSRADHIRSSPEARGEPPHTYFDPVVYPQFDLNSSSNAAAAQRSSPPSQSLSTTSPLKTVDSTEAASRPVLSPSPSPLSVDDKPEKEVNFHLVNAITGSSSNNHSTKGLDTQALTSPNPYPIDFQELNIIGQYPTTAPSTPALNPTIEPPSSPPFSSLQEPRTTTPPSPDSFILPPCETPLSAILDLDRQIDECLSMMEGALRTRERHRARATRSER